MLALSWLFAAIGCTVWLAPQRGARGWLWLALHHAICLVGCTHELRAAWRRRKAGMTATSPPSGR